MVEVWNYQTVKWLSACELLEDSSTSDDVRDAVLKIKRQAGGHGRPDGPMRVAEAPQLRSAFHGPPSVNPCQIHLLTSGLR